MTTAQPVRTYHPRQGRLTDRHRAALAGVGSRLGLVVGRSGAGADVTSDHGLAGEYPYGGLDAVDGGRIDLAGLFGRDAPVVLEIGTGMGEATAAMAAADPDRDYLAVEVHRPGLANLLSLVDAAGLTNVRVVAGDAVELLRHQLAPDSLDAVHVYFPDPWPKARHHKRRLIQAERVELLRSRLRCGGVLHCATDWPPYADQMVTVLTADPGLSSVYERWAPRGRRPVTRFEARALAAGRPVVDLLFRRQTMGSA